MLINLKLNSNKTKVVTNKCTKITRVVLRYQFYILYQSQKKILTYLPDVYIGGGFYNNILSDKTLDFMTFILQI